MIGLDAVCARFRRLERGTLLRWIELGWVRPRQAGEEPAWTFDETDVARVALLCDLRFEIALEEESLPVVLSLLDQLYDLRRQLGHLVAALGELPPEARHHLRAAIARRAERPDHDATR